MYGYLIPRLYKEALEFDKENNNTKWADATRDEMDCIKEQQVFTKGQKAKWDSTHKKDQGKLDICGEIQWGAQGKACS